MKAVFNIARTNPSSIEEIVSEDIARIQIDDSFVSIYFNDGTEEHNPLRGNDGLDSHEWSGISLFATRVGLKVDMTQ